MINNPALPADARQLIERAWPGTTLRGEPAPLAGGFWASMWRLQLQGQPAEVPGDVVFRLAPDAAMGAKELAVQQCLADLGYPTPHVRLTGVADLDRDAIWSLMDFADGVPPLGDLNGLAALRRAPQLFTSLPRQLATTMAALHAIDPDPVSAAVAAAAPSVAWKVDDLVVHFSAAAEALGRADLVTACRTLVERRPVEGPTVICHGDLHPFNLLVDQQGHLTVIDWTAAIRAEPAYDLAFTTLLLANPPLNARAPVDTVIHSIGNRLAHSFMSRYRAPSPNVDLDPLNWYRALHGLRILLEAASQELRLAETSQTHPIGALVPAASKALTSVTGSLTAPRS